MWAGHAPAFAAHAAGAWPTAAAALLEVEVPLPDFVELAETFADAVDCHALADLVERGCSLGLALEIVR